MNSATGGSATCGDQLPRSRPLHKNLSVRSSFSADPEGLRKVSGGLVLSLGFTTRPSQQQTATPTPLPYTRQITGQSWRRPTASRLSLTTAFVVGEVKQHFGTGLNDILRLACVVGDADVLLAGPPCQGHSNLNNHSRRTDERNELYLTVPATAIALNIPLVIIENVPAVFHDRLGVVAATTELLESAGYSVETGVLKADHMGWAQRRSRFFLVASRLGPPIPLATVQEGLQFARPIGWAIDELLGDLKTITWLE